MQPGGNAKGLCRLFITNVGEFQPRADFHPHVRPKPGAFAPHDGSARCRRKLAFHARCRVREYVSALLVKSEAHDQAIRTNGTRSTLLTGEPC